MYKLLFRFTIISDVYKNTFTKHRLYSVDFKAPRELWNPLSKTVPSNFTGMADIVNGTVYKTSFDRSRAWQIVLIFNTASALVNMLIINKHIFTESVNAVKFGAASYSSSYCYDDQNFFRGKFSQQGFSTINHMIIVFQRYILTYEINPSKIQCYKNTLLFT